MMTDEDIDKIIKNIKFSIDTVEELAKQKNVDKKIVYILLGKCFGKLEILKEYKNRIDS